MGYDPTFYNQNVKKMNVPVIYVRTYKHISVVVIGREDEIIVKYVYRLKYLTTFLSPQYKYLLTALNLSISHKKSNNF